MEKQTRITYVEGWPENVPLSFDYLQSLKITERLTGTGDLYRAGRVWNYEGSLEREDFDAIDKIFRSDQYLELASDKEKFLERLKLALNKEKLLTNTLHETQIIHPLPKRTPRKGIIGKLFRQYDFVEQEPYKKETDHIGNIELQTSKNLIGELEKIIEKYGMPDSAISAQSLILKEAKRNGDYSKIGEYLEFVKSNHSNITVFLDNELKGTIQFIPDEEKRNSYIGAYPGEYDPVNIRIDVNGKVITIEKNMWCCGQGNVTLWELDEKIREEILNEKVAHRFVEG